MNKKIKVLIVDDSAFIRMLMTQILEQDSQLDVVGTAADPYEAREKIKKHNPDVLTLDIEMPKMDGVTFLKNIMRLRPMPVVMVSTLTLQGAEIADIALQLGAVDFVAKPKADVRNNLIKMSQELIEKVKIAANCNTAALDTKQYLEQTVLPLSNKTTLIDIIALGASTGGTEAIQSILRQLPRGMPPIVMVQHIPDVFSTSYAKRLDNHCELKVTEVRQAQKLKSGHAYLAPGHRHMKVVKKNNELWAELSNGDACHHHKPAVDVLFQSIAQIPEVGCIAALLTGMGQDGAQGLLQLRQSGAETLVQDEQSSVVWGMPGAAVKKGGVQKVIPLREIPEYLLKRL